MAGEGGVHPLVDLAQTAHGIPRTMLRLGFRRRPTGATMSAAKIVHRAMADEVAMRKLNLRELQHDVHRRIGCARSILNLRLFVE